MVARSSADAEDIAKEHGVCELLQLKNLLTKLKLVIPLQRSFIVA